MAKQAYHIKETIPEIYKVERENGPIHLLHNAFSESLVKDLNLEDFADMIAQTITYGLFSARASGTELYGIDSLAQSIPATNPFLRDLFLEFSSLAGHGPGQLDFDDLYLELISMLNSIALEDILDDFGTQFLGGKEEDQ